METLFKILIFLVLICINHFTSDAFEDNSKKLKTDAVPTIFPSSQNESPIKNAIEEPHSKKLKVTNITPASYIKETDHQPQCIQIPDETSQISMLDEIKHKTTLPGLKIHSVFISKPNEKLALLKELPVKYKYVKLEKNMLDAIKPNINSNVSQIQTELEPQELEINKDTNVVPSSNYKVKGIQRNEDYNIKHENVDTETGVSSLAEELTEEIDSNEGELDSHYFIKQIKKLRELKQSLLEESKNLQEQDQEITLKLQGLKNEAKAKREDPKNLSNKEVEVLKKCFSTAQIRSLTGKMKCRWSLDDLAVAYTISSLSSREFYEYLRTNLKYPLPASSNINRCFKSKCRTKNKKDF